MKKTIFVFIAFFLFIDVFAQPMHVKRFNFTSFGEDKRMDISVLDKESSDEAKRHPEYGIRPYNAQCVECVELLDKRDLKSRQFIRVDNPHRTYSQQSFLPLHYKKTENDIWRTIDYRLRPDANTPGVYAANNQPVPTICDLNRKLTSLNENGFVFECNKDLTMYFYDENFAYTAPEKGNYSQYTIGEEGLEVKNMWKGIDMQEIFSIGEVESNFVINAPLQLPISKGWMVIEDHFSLPMGIIIEESPSGKHLENGFYQGDYLIKDITGKTLITYEKPAYTDAIAFSMHGMYKLLNTGNDYTLQVLVPISWLTNKNNTYPITIDPVIFGETKIGNFLSSGDPMANLKFTTRPGSCDNYMEVVVPGNSQLTDIYTDIEYSLTYDNTCGNPPEPAPYCTFSQASMTIVNNTCNTVLGPLSCNPAFPPYTGTCTTDSNLVPLARSIHVNAIIPDYLACSLPQCPDFHLPFTLKDQDSICGDVCGYLCARGNIWRTTVYACQVEGYITPVNTTVCAGQPDTFVAHPDCGVPPYHFAWSTDGGNTYTVIHNSPIFVVYPEQNMVVSCVIYDSCDKFWLANTGNITILSTPNADAGPYQYLCEGGTVKIGGTPTNSPANTTIQWTGKNPVVESWLSSTTDPNPSVTVPAGTIDSFYYVVTVSNTSCFRTDTVWVFSLQNPQPVIGTSGATTVCANQTDTLNVTQSYSKYAWSTGSTSSTIVVSQPADYQVTVTDAHNCTGSSNTVTISTIAVPAIHVYPDTTIHFGDSVTMYSDLDLSSPIVDSFFWYPFFDISCINCPNPVVSPPTDQFYGVRVYTTGGCIIGDSALIRVILPNAFYIPNVFNPNNPTGYNTTFYVYYQSGVTVKLFQVFDRWGEKVYEGNNLPSGTGWDGTFKGKPAPADVYVYICRLGLFGQEGTVLRKGSVTLIR